MSFRFIICPVLSSVPLGEIDVTGVTFTQSVDGTGTTFTGMAVISETQTADKLKSYLNYPNDPEALALYVKDEDGYLWGGPLIQRPWDPDNHAFQITAVSWKSWLYQRFLTPDVTVNPVVDIKYAWTSTEQFDIARAIVTYATGGAGTPTINLGTETSGIQRDLTIFGSEFVYAGEAIDRMASRSKGFEWDIEVREDNAGNPALWLVLYYPKKSALNSSVLFKSTPAGGNIIKFTNPDDTAETVIPRVWGTGSGTAGTDLLMAYDQDTNLASDTILLRESKEYTNATTTDINTIASHVQGIRAYHASGLQQMQVTVPLDTPAYTDYATGNKVRLIVQDEVFDLDLSSVRIVRRTFRVNAGGDQPATDQLDLLIDLNDIELPENEEAI
jgi:hypothetical protein